MKFKWCLETKHCAAHADINAFQCLIFKDLLVQFWYCVSPPCDFQLVDEQCFIAGPVVSELSSVSRCSTCGHFYNVSVDLRSREAAGQMSLNNLHLMMFGQLPTVSAARYFLNSSNDILQTFLELTWHLINILCLTVSCVACQSLAFPVPSDSSPDHSEIREFALQFSLMVVKKLPFWY